MNRRRFLFTATATSLALGAPLPSAHSAELPLPRPEKLPRWRGFNLLEKFTKRNDDNPPFSERDFAWISEFGFNFVRLPMSYLCWVEPGDWLKFREDQLKHIDQAVELGRKHNVHVNINFHRAPGYCVNPPKEPLDLWTDPKALEVCSTHWALFAKRYKGLPNTHVTFDLLNEPPDIPREQYIRVVEHLVKAIRAEDPNRLIIADGLRWGRDPLPELAPLKIGQSTRGYDPMQISHYHASWVNGSDKYPTPQWPMPAGNREWNKQRLFEERIKPWKELEAKGCGVHVGEWGAYQKTPHPVALKWMEDQLQLWKEAGWGWALWNFRGSFGILNSGRDDVQYEDFRGEKLDRKMLELIQRY